MRVRVGEGQRPIKVKVRRYGREQRLWMDKYLDQLVEMGYFEENAFADWQAAPLIVPKPNSKAKWRMAIDLRPVNSATVKEQWPMPDLDAEMVDFAESDCFCSLDFVSGYWQLPLHSDSYSACGIITPRGVYTSRRVFPGLANAVAFFQRSVAPLFASLCANLKAWLDDFGLHANGETKLLDVLEAVLLI